MMKYLITIPNNYVSMLMVEWEIAVLFFDKVKIYFQKLKSFSAYAIICVNAIYNIWHDEIC